MTVGGKAKVLDARQWAKLEKVCKSEVHKVIWALLRFTGCRSQEARLLTVDNVYSDPENRVVRDAVYFPKKIRKGGKFAISVPINEKLKTYLQNYNPPLVGFLFPSPRNPEKSLSYEAILKYLENCAEKAGLGHEKITTHSGRRSLITHLHSEGFSLKMIQSVTGHRSLKNLEPYIEVDENQVATMVNQVAL